MGAVEDAVDAAAEFIGPFVGKSHQTGSDGDILDLDATELVEKALSHLRAINAADLATDPDAPYDASLAGVVYGLLDLITSLSILPYLSCGVAFGLRPRSVLSSTISPGSDCGEIALQRALSVILPIEDQGEVGIQPLLSQRILPDIISALAELSFSPVKAEGTRNEYLPIFRKIIVLTPISRLLPILTTFLQQPLPPWLQPVLSKELAIVPLRKQGIRHIIEFLSLACLSRNSQLLEDITGPRSQIPISLEAVAQTSGLLARPPAGISQDEWLRVIAPQLLSLLDGDEGGELSRAAGQIIARGILSKKSTGAPGTVGWAIFAQPLLQSICPQIVDQFDVQGRGKRIIVVLEEELELALKRLLTITNGYSHAGLLRRLVGPVILPLWALLNYATASPALDKRWAMVARSILLRYMNITCDAKQANTIARDLFWDGGHEWTFGPGTQGGVEIRRRGADTGGVSDINNTFTRLKNLDWRVSHFVSLLTDAKLPDDVAGRVFLSTTERWLSLNRDGWKTLIDGDKDPLAALIDAKLSEAMAIKFKEQFVRSPQHIMDLMAQLIRNFVNDHQTLANIEAESNSPSRTQLRTIVPQARIDQNTQDTSDDDVVSFSISILSMLITAPEFKRTPETHTILDSIKIPLVYLSQAHTQFPIARLITNSANELLHLIEAPPTKSCAMETLANHRTNLKAAQLGLTSEEPPNRTWALQSLHKIIQNPVSFSIIDVPSTTHLLVWESLADPESYVHTAAIPVLCDLAALAPNPVISIVVEAFIDMDEQSFKSARERQLEEQKQLLQAALDFRLRLGEVLSKFIIENAFWTESGNTIIRYSCTKKITDACLLLAGRRGQRQQGLQTRIQIRDEEHKIKEESEAAWGGPIPNFLDTKDENPQDQADHDVLQAILQGWHDRGIEEDIRLRTSALSVLSSVIEHRLGFLKQITVDSALQFAVLVLTIETSEAQAILRRAAVLVVMAVLRGLALALESDKEQDIGLSRKQEDDMARVIGWVKDEDADTLVRDYATSVFEGLEALQLKKLYMTRNQSWSLGSDFGSHGQLRGFQIDLDESRHRETPNKMIIEELE